MKIKKQVEFEKLSSSEQEKIIQAIPKGLVEVNCPWWAKDHWEKKVTGEPFYNCFYRLVLDKKTRNK